MARPQRRIMQKTSPDLLQRSRLFVTEEGPMAFYVPPCLDGGRLRGLVKAGGGRIATRPGEGEVINIVPSGAACKKLQEQKGISSRFITDTMELQQLQDLALYRTGPLPPPPGHGAGKARKKFTAEEDAALVRWVKANSGLRSQGRELWERAQRANVTLHTWQSMQNRWRRRLKAKPAKRASLKLRSPAKAKDAAEIIDLDDSQPIADGKQDAGSGASALAQGLRRSMRMSLSQTQRRKVR
ncbi:unnamed protein product [Effrenium voratum]|nr:unnamed protein product [Effrenium voratum]